jgi:hypothetical protein
MRQRLAQSCVAVGFPTKVLGIEKGKRGKKEGFVSNISNVTNFQSNSRGRSANELTSV